MTIPLAPRAVSARRLLLCLLVLMSAVAPIRRASAQSLDPTITPQASYLKASNTDALDTFGVAVAVSGDTVVVGAPTEDSAAIGIDGDQADNSLSDAGAAYVFVRSATGWTQQAYLKASNPGPGDHFGTSVAVSGDTIVIGAPGESGGAGAAYVFVRSGGTWSQQAYLKASNPDAGDAFASAVAISDDTVVVGAAGEDSGASGVNGDQTGNAASNAGAAYVFARKGTVWTQQAYLKAANPGANDQFGSSVGASGDTVVVGALGEASSAGAAYVFVRNGTAWAQQAHLKASNPDAGDQFGFSIAVSGDTAVVGALLEASNATGVNGDAANNSARGSGAAYVFVRSGTTWAQEAYLKASNTDPSDGFGSALGISGDVIAVGARSEDGGAAGVNGNAADNSKSQAGAAYLFSRSDSAWTPRSYVKASNPDPFDGFGYSVAVAGSTMVVGARGESSSATGVDGNQADNSSGAAGAAYVFEIPPIASAGADQTAEATSSSGVAVTLNGSGSFDPGGGTLTYRWTDAGSNVIGSTAVATVVAPFGASTYTLTVSSTDASSVDTVVVTVQDTIGPSIVIASPIAGSTFRQFQAVAAAYTCSDAASEVATCTGSVENGDDIDTNNAPTGPMTFHVSATDGRNNSSAVSVSYNVTPLMVQITAVSSGGACASGDGTLTLSGCRPTPFILTVTGVGLSGVLGRANVVVPIGGGTSGFSSSCGLATPGGTGASGTSLPCTITPTSWGTPTTVLYLNGSVRSATTFSMSILAPPCEAGTYRASPNDQFCAEAPPGSFVPAPGATSSTLCAPGTFSATSGALFCTPAPPGTFVNGTGAVLAKPCDVGTFSAVIGAAACMKAPPGSFVGEMGAIAATPCEVGTFSAMGGAAECTPAPPGSFVSEIGAVEATPCALGTFSAVSGAAACVLAPPGRFVDAIGAKEATPCAAGTFSAVSGAVKCVIVPPGSFSEVGAIAAKPCAAGTFSAVSGAAVCTPAPPGTFVSAIGAIAATPCAVGTYSAVSGAAACVPAPPGKFVDQIGAITATPCAAGTFSAVSGSVKCMPAPPGSFVSEVGAIAAKPCAVGTFSALSGAAICTPAPPGMFVSAIGAIAATPCAVGTFSAVSGAAACIPAPPGTFVSQLGAAAATACPPGTFSNISGAAACMLAPPGSFVATSGAIAATPCAAGTFSATSGAMECTPAPAGSFVKDIGATSAQLCAAGTYTSGPGAIFCLQAPRGSYVPLAGAIVPIACPAGTTSDPGATGCTPLPTPDGLMSGYGFIDEGRTHDHFLFRVDQFNQHDFGRFEYWSLSGGRHGDDDDDAHDGKHDGDYGRDHRPMVSVFQATSVAAVVFSDDPAFAPGRGHGQPSVDTVVVTGTGRWNGRSGYTFELHAADRGEPGRNRDTLSIVIRSSTGVVVNVSGAIDGGNVESTRLR